MLDSVEALVAVSADVRHELEEPTLVGFINQHRDCELVGVKVPGELLTRIHDVGRQSGEWIGITMQLANFEAVRQEPSKRRRAEQKIGGAARVPRVARDKSRGPFDERVHGVVLGELVVQLSVEIRIDRLL